MGAAARLTPVHRGRVAQGEQKKGEGGHAEEEAAGGVAVIGVDGVGGEVGLLEEGDAGEVDEAPDAEGERQAGRAGDDEAGEVGEAARGSAAGLGHSGELWGQGSALSTIDLSSDRYFEPDPTRPVVP